MTSLQESISLSQVQTDNPVFGLSVQPKSCSFTNYEVNHRYSFFFSITNCEKHVIRLRVVAPSNKQFSLFENGKQTRTTGSLAPGLSVGYELIFLPENLQPISDSLLIQTEKGSLTFDISAQVPTPIITLPQIIDCGPCYADKSNTISIPFRNLGGKGTFGFFRSDEGTLLCLFESSILFFSFFLR